MSATQETVGEGNIEISSYSVTDKYFGKPYIDRDEWRDRPVRHRNVHGGFEGTATRFTFYFPLKEYYKGRMFQPLEGAHADLDTMQAAYRKAVEAWIAAIRDEEALASVAHNVAEIDRWVTAEGRGCSGTRAGRCPMRPAHSSPRSCATTRST